MEFVVASVVPKEPISRFLFRKKDMCGEEVVAAAFLPSRTDRETSVFRVLGLSEESIWDIGINHVQAERQKNGAPESLKGRADFVADQLPRGPLRIVPEISLHERHANIVGWGDDEPSWLQFAADLALVAKAHRLPVV